MFFTENGYYSGIIDFSFRNFYSKVSLLLLKKILFLVGLTNENPSIRIIRIDDDITFIRGNIIEKSLVIIRKDYVIKIYDDIPLFSKKFYIDYYPQLGNGTLFSVPSILNIKNLQEHFMIVFEKVIVLDNNATLKDIKQASDSFIKVLQNLSTTSLEIKKPSVESNENIIKIDKLIQDNINNIDLLVSHGDFWAGNLLMDKNGQMFIIDFDNLNRYPKDYDFVYYFLNEVVLENENFLMKVLTGDMIYYSRLDEFTELKGELENLNLNEFLFFASKFRYNLLNNNVFTSYGNDIVMFLEKLIDGYSVINQINTNE